MTVIEALSDGRFLSGELWARPVAWRGDGQAYASDLQLGGLVGIPEVVPRAMSQLKRIADLAKGGLIG